MTQASILDHQVGSEGDSDASQSFALGFLSDEFHSSFDVFRTRHVNKLRRRILSLPHPTPV